MANIKNELQKQLAGASDAEAVEILFEFMRRRGASHYEESVTQMEHALQCAQLAAEADCSGEQITAALFHDIGHLLLDEDDAIHEQDLNHELAGANLLQSYFPPSVTGPIRLHVAAKRYLCTTDATYYDQLSNASKRSFRLQGGKLSSDERASLEADPSLPTALLLRRFDDMGKILDQNPPPIETYTQVVIGSLRSDRP